MKNIKRILNLILIILAMLFTFVVFETYAIVTDEMDATGIKSHWNDKLTLNQYRSNYDIFCCMHGIPAWNEDDATINYSDGTSENINNKTNVPKVTVGEESFFGWKIKTIDISNNLTLSTKYGDNCTLRNIKYTIQNNKNGIDENGIATPEEAYILAEMTENIYNKNITRELLNYEETGDTLKIPTLTYESFKDNLTLAFNIFVGENDVQIYKNKYSGKYYIEGEKNLLYVELKEIKFLTDEIDFHDDWSLSSYVQKAWWLVDWVNDQSAPSYKATSGSKSIKNSQLSDEAKAFEDYILNIAGVSDVSDLTFEEQNYSIKKTDASGNIVESEGEVIAPVLDYEPSWNDLGEEAVATWDSATKTYKIGPFAINYHNEVYNNAKYPDRAVLFSGITGVKVISNLKDEDGSIIEGKYTFLHENTGKIDYTYPEPNEKFYIVIPYIEGLTEIKNIEFSFKHMNAGAIFNYYEVEGIKEEWEIVSYCTVCKAKNPSTSHNCLPEGSSSLCKRAVYISRVSSEGTGKSNIQSMAHGLKAARWSEEASLETNVDLPENSNSKFGQLKIIKKVEDSNGNEIRVDEDKVFTFEVSIQRDGEEDVTQTVSITVPKGQSTGSVLLQTEVWEEGKTPPHYIVVEKNPGSVVIEGHKYIGTENSPSEGDFEADETKEVIIINKYNTTEEKLNKGKIRIIKEIVDEDGNPKELTEDKTFKFNLEVTNRSAEVVSITVPAGSTSASWVSGEYTWAEDATAPGYKVIETDSAGCNLKSIQPDIGTLLSNDIITVIAKNEYSPSLKEGYISIKKELVDKDGNPKEATKDEPFQFKVYINGEEKFTPIVTIKEGESSTDIWTSDVITWKEDEANPTYKVEEVLPTDEFRLYEMINSTGSITEGNSTEPARLVMVKNTNEWLEKNTGKLRIIKQLVDKEGKTIVTAEEKPFKFHVTIYDTDEKINKLYEEDITINVPSGSSFGVWESELYKWTENVPYYEVEEIGTPSEYSLKEISNKNGNLKNKDTVEVKAINEKDNEDIHNGKIKIFKKLVDSEGRKLVADKDYTFKFKVTVEGQITQYVDLTILEGSSEAEWESEIYTWQGTIAPTYKVEEIDSNGFISNIVNKEGKLSENTLATQVIAINSERDTLNKGKIKIIKNVSPTRDEPQTFKFDVYMTYDDIETKEQVEITIPSNGVSEEWESGEYYWTTDENAPRYRVVETDNGGYQDTTIENDNGYLENKEEPIPVKVFNTDPEKQEYEKGELQIAKTLTDGTNNFTGKTFEFDVWVEGYGTETVTIEAGNSWAKEYTWIKGEKIPEYTVTEKPASGYNIFSGASGSLKANNTVVVEAINTFNYKNSGSIKIQKTAIVEDKIDNSELKNIPFKFKTTIYYDDPNEYFIYEGKAYNSIEIFKEITPGCGDTGETSGNFDNFENPEIKVYFEKGDNGPKYVVEEIYAPVGWKLISVEDEEGTIQKGTTKIAKFTNKLPIERKYILTMEMGGFVWNDTNYSNGKPADSLENGLKEETEPGMQNVIVEVKLGNEVKYTLLTDGNGKWSIPNMPVPYSASDPNARYHVEYTYDGQTYKPTLALASGSASEYKSASSNADRKKYLNNSMAIEIDSKREAFNNKFAEIWGGNPIKDDGTTKGHATGETLEYISKDVEYNGYVKKASELVTTDENGITLEKYRMTAYTSELGLYYPFDTRTTLASADRQIIEGVPNVTYTYHAAYPYLNNINLGLVERPHADIALEKELEEAVVVINGKIYKYKYGEIANTQFAQYPDLLYKQIQINQRNIEYKLNLYQSDYYYRASVYKSDSDLWGAMVSKYIDVDEELNLDVYLKYKITVTNESDGYNIKVNQISDYADSNLELVERDVEKYIDNIDGNEDGKVVVAQKTENWTKDRTYIDSTPVWRESSPIEYTRYIYSEPISLNSGDSKDLHLTFKAKNALDTLGTGLDDCVVLGDKNNIAEIDSYSTYYADADDDYTNDIVAGRVDEDSAPGNISFTKNMVQWYEDDTDKAPTIKLGLYDIKRSIDGLVWEDKEEKIIEYSQTIGDGKYTDGEDKIIPNMTTKLVEKVEIDGKDYDFIWPTDDLGFNFRGKTIKQLTGFDSEILTDGEGKYEFTGIPAGNYVVRFIYGDDNTLDLNKIDDKGNIKYSGQDYKSTTYQVGWRDVTQEWHNIEEDSNRNPQTHISDARDDEARRLEVIAKSQNLFYENTSIMKTNTSSYGINNNDERRYNDSLETYFMIANTAKLNMNVESISDAKAAITKGTVTSSGGTYINILNANLKIENSIKISRINYNVKDIDFGIETRSENNIELDKQIEQITLKTSAGDVLIDAIYDIDYDASGKVTVKLNPNSIGTQNLQALNRTDTTLGFRYLNVDKDILQGATITIKYRITALNTGEVDRCNQKLIDLGELLELDGDPKDGKYKYTYKLEDALETIRDEEAKSTGGYNFGQYLGNVYYQGANHDDSYNWSDKVVTTKVKQVIDYVDNDVVFSQMDNIAKDASWANTTTADLTDNRLVDLNIIDGASNKILDSNNVAYESDSKNNLIVSVENDLGTSLSNPNLMKALTPYDDTYSGDHEAYINVTVSRYYASDMDIEEVENIAETLKLYNDVGRRDLKTVQGNISPAAGPLEALSENDSSATELITLSPPTGALTTTMLILQIMAVTLTAITILAGGITIIKKKLLK